MLKREGLRGGAQEGVLRRGCSGWGAQERVLRRGCSGGGAQEKVLRRGIQSEPCPGGACFFEGVPSHKKKYFFFELI